MLFSRKRDIRVTHRSQKASKKLEFFVILSECDLLFYTFIHRGFHALQILFVLFHQVPSQLSHVHTINVFVLVVSVGYVSVLFSAMIDGFTEAELYPDS